MKKILLICMMIFGIIAFLISLYIRSSFVFYIGLFLLGISARSYYKNYNTDDLLIEKLGIILMGIIVVVLICAIFVVNDPMGKYLSAQLLIICLFIKFNLCNSNIMKELLSFHYLKRTCSENCQRSIRQGYVRTQGQY